MTNFIPIFPLEIVVFPGETLNLHIFEDRYKQLIKECVAEKKYFGIPVVINGAIAETGTVVEITEMVKEYGDGSMDIITEGKSIYRVLEIIKIVPDKLFSGAIVNHLQNNITPKRKMQQEVLALIRELHKLLGVNKPLKKNDDDLLSYDLANHAGLTLKEEYELLLLLREDQRLEYLKQQLQKILPVVAATENLKNKIQMNGHFKELKGFNINL